MTERIEETGRRREQLVGRAMAAGHSREYADRIYDVAMEEHLDPALAFEIVLDGKGVRDLAPEPPDNWEEAQVEAPPEWINEPPPAEEAERERHLRLSFRRLRSLVERSDSPDAALSAFLAEPDVGEVDY